ncbi:MAG: sigma-70 family RNA polymerase sigma factor [Bacteroidetes bacterium]|nr:sigma-70 family RNA polymerase sigma factor [Bacteroidota bacterium]
MFWKKGRIYSDDDIVQGFRNPDPKVVNYVYSSYYKLIESFILKHGGAYEDVKDVFQEGLSVVYLKVQQQNFKLNSAFGTYLFSICKNRWFFELRRRKYSSELLSNWEQDETVDDGKSFAFEVMQERKENLFRKHYVELDEECQQIMRLFLKKIPFKEIAEIMGYDSEMNAIKRKARCKEILMKRIKNDPDFTELY